MTYPDIIEIVAANPRSGATSASGQHNFIRSAINDLDTRATALEAIPLQVFDIRAYGAEVDGATDDTVAVTAAITAAAVAGGIVFFPPGTCMTNKLTLKQGVSLMGVPGVSVVKLRNTQATALLTTDGFVTTDSNAGLYGFVIQDLIFDGNMANQASNADQAVVQIYGYNYSVRRCIIRNAKTYCFYSNWSSQSDPPGPDGRGMEAVIEDLVCILYTTGGINFVGPHDSYMSRVIVSDLTGSGGTTGIILGARAYGVKISQSHGYGNGHDYALDINTPTGVQVEASQWEGAQTAQVRIKDTNGTRITNCKVYDAGTIAAPVGIVIDGADGYQILNNEFINLDTATILFTNDDGAGLIAQNYIYQTTGSVFSGAADSNTTIRDNEVAGGATGGPLSAITISGGLATVHSGIPSIALNGEGAAADVLDNLTIHRSGKMLPIIANHQITFNTSAGGSGQILCPGGVDYVLAQYGAVILLSSDPNWVLIEG